MNYTSKYTGRCTNEQQTCLFCTGRLQEKVSREARKRTFTPPLNTNTLPQKALVTDNACRALNVSCLVRSSCLIIHTHHQFLESATNISQLCLRNHQVNRSYSLKRSTNSLSCELEYSSRDKATIQVFLCTYNSKP